MSASTEPSDEIRARWQTAHDQLAAFEDADRKNFSVYMPIELIDRARAIVHHAALHGDPEIAGSLSELATYALHRVVVDIERDFNEGEPLPVPRRLTAGPQGDGVRRMVRTRESRRRAQS